MLTTCRLSNQLRSLPVAESLELCLRELLCVLIRTHLHRTQQSSFPLICEISINFSQICQELINGMRIKCVILDNMPIMCIVLDDISISGVIIIEKMLAPFSGCRSSIQARGSRILWDTTSSV